MGNILEIILNAAIIVIFSIGMAGAYLTVLDKQKAWEQRHNKDKDE
tara:strand:+ start:426 stop:563 length:138 start_codon:yes stop_codon:yes gene_type:complete